METIIYERLGPGKFSDTVDEWLYDQSMIGADDELGEADTFGWYGLLLFPERVKVIEADTSWYFKSAIVTENSQGFFYAETYDTIDEGKEKWKAIEKEYEDFLKIKDINDTEIHTWFERDRKHVELRDIESNETIIEWWDDEVDEMVEMGFLDPRDWHGSAYEYAVEHNLIAAP